MKRGSIVIISLLAVAALAGGALLMKTQRPETVSISDADIERMGEAILAKGQILLRNQMKFTQGRESGGASAFIVNDGTDEFVVTAKHLLGEAMGIEPAVLPSEFDEALVSWDFYFPNSDQPISSVTNIRDTTDSTTDDLLKLDVDDEPISSSKMGAQALEISTAKLTNTAPYFLIGCPYAEEQCTQNAYPVSYMLEECFDGNSCAVYFELKDKSFDLAGFSGAPIVDKDGKLVSILSGSQPFRLITQKYF